MNLSFSKIPNNGQTINFKQELIIPIDFNRMKNMFTADYKPLDISIESRKGSQVIELFSKRFVHLYNQKEKLSKSQQKHFNQIVK
jgi:hypothetical protein